MRTEEVEIFSDATNAVVIRHPDRRFPGVLLQGDTLYSLCSEADEACRSIGREAPGFEAANEVRNRLWALLSHYKLTLIERGLPLPFSEQR